MISDLIIHMKKLLDSDCSSFVDAAHLLRLGLYRLQLIGTVAKLVKSCSNTSLNLILDFQNCVVRGHFELLFPTLKGLHEQPKYNRRFLRKLVQYFKTKEYLFCI